MSDIDLKRLVIAMTFTELPYRKDDLMFMLPGIFHRILDKNSTYFEELVEESLSYCQSEEYDAGGYLVKLAYYEHMADTVDYYLEEICIKDMIMDKLLTHYVDEATITANYDLFITLIPKLGHTNKF